MLSLIRNARTNADDAIVARDLLLERGYGEERIARAFGAYVPLAVRLAAETIVDEIRRRANAANGRIRMRRIELFQIGQAIRDALESGIGRAHGGYPTASSYGYSWEAGACSAVWHRDTETMRVRIERTHRRSCPWGLNGTTDRTKPGTDAFEALHTRIEVASDLVYDLAFGADVAALVATRLIAAKIGD